MAAKLFLRAVYASALPFITTLAATTVISNLSAFFAFLFWPILALSILMFSLGLLLVRRNTKLYSSYELVLEEQHLRLRFNEADQTLLARSEAKELITIDGEGVTIAGPTRSSCISVPMELQSYDEFLSSISNWSHLATLKRFNKWAIVALAFYMLYGMAIFVLLTAYVPNELNSLRQLYLILFWLTFVASEVLTDGVFMNGFVKVSRHSKPILFWLLIVVECIPFLWLPSFDTTALLNLETSLLIGNTLLVFVWIAILSTLMRRNLGKSSSHGIAY